jgi:hypothetical protein
MANKLSKYVSARITPETLRRIERIAASKEWSLSKVVAKLIEQGLARQPESERR